MKTSRNKSNLKLQSPHLLSSARYLTGNAKKKREEKEKKIKRTQVAAEDSDAVNPQGPQEQPLEVMCSCVFKEPAD